MGVFLLVRQDQFIDVTRINKAAFGKILQIGFGKGF
jgi:hypothetical protein